MELSPGGSPKDPQERPRTPQGTPKELPRDPQAAPRIPEGHPRAKGHAKISKGSPNRTRLMIGFGSRACRAWLFFFGTCNAVEHCPYATEGLRPPKVNVPFQGSAPGDFWAKCPYLWGAASARLSVPAGFRQSCMAICLGSKQIFSKQDSTT